MILCIDVYIANFQETDDDQETTWMEMWRTEALRTKRGDTHIGSSDEDIRPEQDEEVIERGL